MKKLLLSSVVLTVFSLSMILFQFSCKKEAVVQTTTDTLTKAQILVSKTWKVDKIHNLLLGQYSEYTNGGTNTTGVNYDNLRFTFNSNGTGTHISETGASYNLTWSFTSTDFRSLQLTVNGRTDNWEMLEIAHNYLHASVNLTLNGDSNNTESFRLIQIP